MMRQDDSGVSAVIGGILVFALLGVSILYVDGLYVPKQGAAMELAAREKAESSLTLLAGQLTGASSTVAGEVLLAPERGTPSLLPGVILEPARQAGRSLFNASGSNLTITHVLPNGTTVYDAGNATSGLALGRFTVSIGGTYLDSATYVVEGGAVLADRGATSSAVGAPLVRVTQGGSPGAPTNAVSWIVPILAGPEAEIDGTGSAEVALAAGPVSSVGGGALVQSVTIVVRTDALGAWRAALVDALHGRGTVTTSPGAAADTGSVTATITTPPGGTSPAVSLDLGLVQYAVTLASRGG